MTVGLSEAEERFRHVLENDPARYARWAEKVRQAWMAERGIKPPPKDEPGGA